MDTGDRPRDRRRVRRWRYVAGAPPYTIMVFERAVGGVLSIRRPRAGATRSTRYSVTSLGHRDRAAAMALADAEATALRRLGDAPAGALTVGGALARYLAHRTPQKAPTSQAEDRRRAKLWTAVHGDTPVARLGPAEWDAFIAARSAGTIDAHGARVPLADAVPCGPRGVDADLVFLVSVFNWCCGWRVDGRPLLEANPWGGAVPGVRRALARPRNRAPRQPVATFDRYLAVQAKAPLVTWEVRGEAQPTYLPVLLTLAEGTGRRISALCRLWYSDLLWSPAPRPRVTAVRWRPFKTEDEQVVPVTDEVGAALTAHVRAHPGMGDVPIFPSARDPNVPVSRWTASAWLHAAEALAEVPPLAGGAWHPYRRKWATERKALPDADVMRAGGWRDLRSLKASYQHADDATVLAVVNAPTKLRARR